ncbi:MAG: hypothetical protein IKS42_07850 [Oscillospiraceae bacterium]|nr:hypothetical protein [Oscillospiraceae bacterium]
MKVRLLKSKTVSYGLIEVYEQSDGWYGLYINGDLKEQSPDLNFILSEYDKRY